MAAVKSLLRSVLKPILFKILGRNTYLWFQFLAKTKDIEKKLVEEDEMELLPHFVSENSVAFDIGANYAYYTVRLAKLCPKGVVYAFEPIPETFEVCNRILKHYRLKNVRMFQQGVGEKNTLMQFEVPIQDSGFISAGQAHLLGRHNELPEKRIYYPWNKNLTYECQVISLDQEFSNLQRLDFIKIDIEGAELFALKGMVNTLKKFHPVILAEICKFWLNGFNITAQEISSFISEELGYNIYYYLKKEKSLLRVPSLVDDKRYNYVDNVNLTPFAPNYILIPKERVREFSKIITQE